MTNYRRILSNFILNPRKTSQRLKSRAAKRVREIGMRYVNDRAESNLTRNVATQGLLSISAIEGLLHQDVVDKYNNIPLQDAILDRETTRSILQVLVDLNQFWAHPEPVGELPSKDSTDMRGSVVIIGDSDVYANQDGWDNDRLIALARQENPDRSIILWCSDQTILRDYKADITDCEIDKVTTYLGSALAGASRAYTIAADSGMDALIRGVPLTVIGSPYYAGWGFTDDRSSLSNRNATFTFEEFFPHLFVSSENIDAGSEEITKKILSAVFDVATNAKMRQTRQVNGKLRAVKNFKSDAAKAKSAISWLSKSDQWLALLDRKRLPRPSVSQKFTVQKLAIKNEAFEVVQNSVARRLICAMVLARFGGGSATEPLLNYAETCLTAQDFHRTVYLYTRLSGIPINLITQDINSDAIQENERRKLESVASSAVMALATNKAQARKKFLAWSKKAYAKRDFQTALDMLECYILTGPATAEVLDTIGEIYWQTFQFDSAAEIFQIGSIMFPDWKAGRFNWRAAYAFAIEENAEKVLPNIVMAAFRNGSSIQRFSALDVCFSDRYPGLPLEEAFERFALETEGTSSVRLASYLSRQNRPEEAEAVLNAADMAEKTRTNYAVEMSYALALQGRHEEARNLIETRLARHGHEAQIIVQGIRLGYFSGNAEWSKNMLDIALKRKIEVSPGLRRQALLAVQQFKSAMLTDREHTVGDLIRPYLRSLHVDNLEQLVDGQGKTLLVAMVNGPADDIRFANLLPKLKLACGSHNLLVSCDPRLKSIFERSFPNIEFIASQRIRNSLPLSLHKDVLPAVEIQEVFDATGWAAASTADRVALITDLIADLVDDPSVLDSRPFLVPDPTRVKDWTNRLEKMERPLVGMAWGSMRTTVMRQYDYFSVDEVIQVIGSCNFQFVNLQYYDCSEELEKIEATHPGRIKHFPDLDQMEDIEGVIALMACLDVVLSPNSSPLIMSTASGVKTWYLDPAISNRYWGRFSQFGTDYWFGNTVYVNGSKPGDRDGLIKTLSTALVGLTEDAGSSSFLEIERLINREPPKLAEELLEYRSDIISAEHHLLSSCLNRDVKYWEVRARVFERLDQDENAAFCWMQACSQTRTPNRNYLRAHWNAYMHLEKPSIAEKFYDDSIIESIKLNEYETKLRDDVKARQTASDACKGSLRYKEQKRDWLAKRTLSRSVNLSWQSSGTLDHAASIALRILRLVNSNDKDIEVPDFSKQKDMPTGYRSFIGRHRRKFKESTNEDAHYCLDCSSNAKIVFCVGSTIVEAATVAEYLQASQKGPSDHSLRLRSPVNIAKLGLFSVEVGVPSFFNPDNLTIRHFVNFLLGPVLGIMKFATSNMDLVANSSWSLAKVFKENNNETILLDLCDQLLSRVEALEPKTHDSLLAAIKWFYAEILDYFSYTYGQLIILPIALHTFNENMQESVTDAPAIFVHKKPQERYKNKNPVHALIALEQNETRQRPPKKGASAIDSEFQSLDIEFEEFVKNETLRKSVTEFLRSRTR